MECTCQWWFWEFLLVRMDGGEFGVGWDCLWMHVMGDLLLIVRGDDIVELGGSSF